MNDTNKNPYSNTVILPKTDFPMKANLAKREMSQIELWQKEQTFKKLQEHNKDKEEFILHDGPPYANGNFHVGHSLNKILKDIIVKSKNMSGYRANMISGWDCHGLPIEVQVLKEFEKKKKKNVDSTELRIRCREYASEWIQKQGEDLTRFLCFWNKDHFYQTMSLEYETKIIDTFGKLFKSGYIYKGKRPIYWCTHLSTSHAEAEIEYHEHTSDSIYVKFPVSNEKNLNCLIWTTTPWTLPANLAICFNKSFSYAIYETESSDKVIVAEKLKEKIEQDTSLKLNYISHISVDELSNLKFNHPFLDKEIIPIFGSHVTLDVGTGCVHTAPGHGEDDYIVGREYNLEPFCPVDRRGRYTNEFALMEGENIFKANLKIIDLLKEKNFLFSHKLYKHSYPYSWRSKKPLIFLTVPQWFMKVDYKDLRKNSIKALESVQWIPDWGINRIGSMVERRPDWCLSRQRNWGVPIPSFVCKSCDETYLTDDTIEYFKQLVEKDGIEIWYNLDVKDLLKNEITCKKCGGKEFDKEGDILDVWFDSGISHFSVLGGKLADLYLEGSDQHRGWFQSSLLPAMALNQKPPYKSVLTHGYVLDANGHAMSKSMGNVISPMEIIEKYGADILRLWVSSQDFRDDNHLGNENLKVLSDEYRKIRNTFRYLLGNLSLHKKEDHLELEDLNEIDLFYLSKFSRMIEKIKSYYENYQFYLIYQKVVYFCNVDLSQDYFEMTRDSLYCNRKNSKSRKSTCTVFYYILNSLAVILSPILSFTSEEVWKSFDSNNRSIFFESFPDLKDFINTSLEEKWEQLFELRKLVQKALEKARETGKIGKSLEAGLVIKTKRHIDLTSEELCIIFVVSKVLYKESLESLEVISTHKSEHDEIEVFIPEDKKCPRCWRHISKSADELCLRCEEVISSDFS